MTTHSHSLSTTNPRKYLTEAQRRAIVAEVARGDKQVAVAARFKVHPNTVNAIVREVRKSGETSALSREWKKTLYEEMVPESVSALRSSIKDTVDIHKAAGTAMAHLKAVGVVANDVSVQVNIFANTQDLPSDWYSRMRPIEDGDAPEIRDITPEESKG